MLSFAGTGFCFQTGMLLPNGFAPTDLTLPAWGAFGSVLLGSGVWFIANKNIFTHISGNGDWDIIYCNCKFSSCYSWLNWALEQCSSLLVKWWFWWTGLFLLLLDDCLWIWFMHWCCKICWCWAFNTLESAVLQCVGKIQTVAVNTTEGANSHRRNLFLLFSVHFQCACCSSASLLCFTSSLNVKSKGKRLIKYT